MKQILTPLTTIVFFTFVLPLYADYGVTDHGTWSDVWLEGAGTVSKTIAQV
jgi:hypothetical protein